MRLFCFIAAVLLIASGCDVQKRHYRKGFYVNHSKSQRQNQSPLNKSLIASASHKIPASDHFIALQLPPDSCDLLTFIDHTSVKVKIVEMDESEVKYYFCDDQQKKIRTARRNSITSIGHGGIDQGVKTPAVPAQNAPVPADTAVSAPQPVAQDTTKTVIQSNCETIVFRDGNERKVNLIEITPTEVRYKNCGEELPLFRRNKSEIFMIVHQDGTREVFKEEPKQPEYTPSMPERQEPYVKKSTGLATTASILCWFGLIPLFGLAFSAAAIIMGIIYIKQAEREPRRYPAVAKAKKAITVAVVLGALNVLLLIFG